MKIEVDGMRNKANADELPKGFPGYTANNSMRVDDRLVGACNDNDGAHDRLEDAL